MRKLLSSVFCLCVVLFSGALHAQDVSGSYALSISQDPGASDCVWTGTLDLTQAGGNPGTFTGSAAVTVVSGPCSDFAGNVSGTINGSTLEIGVAVGGLGSATFSGTVVGPNDLDGTWSGLGLTGIWSAARNAGPGGAASIPTLPQWALLLLIALVTGFSARYMTRRIN